MMHLHTISEGGHDPEEPGACLMEWVSLLASQYRGHSRHIWFNNDGKVSRIDLVVDIDAYDTIKTDAPSCTNSIVTQIAISANDTVSDDQRQRLAKYLPRLLRARPLKYHADEFRLNVKLLRLLAERYGIDEESIKRAENLQTVGDYQWKKTALIKYLGLDQERADILEHSLAYYEGRSFEVTRRELVQSTTDLTALCLGLDEPTDATIDDCLFSEEWAAKVELLLSDVLDLHEKLLAEEGALTDGGLEIDDEEIDALIEYLEGKT